MRRARARAIRIALGKGWSEPAAMNTMHYIHTYIHTYSCTVRIMHKGACGIQRWQTNASREIYIQLTVVGECIHIYIYVLSHFFYPLKSLGKSPQTDLYNIHFIYNIYE